MKNRMRGVRRGVEGSCAGSSVFIRRTWSRETKRFTCEKGKDTRSGTEKGKRRWFFSLEHDRGNWADRPRHGVEQGGNGMTGFRGHRDSVSGNGGYVRKDRRHEDGRGNTEGPKRRKMV